MTPLPPGITVAWINQSTNDLSMVDAARIVEALNLQAADVAAAWPDKPKPLHGLVADPHSVPSGAIPAYWLPNSDVASALGYHDVDPQGRPYIRVFTRPTLQNGGTVLDGDISIAVTTTHEGPEEEVDAFCAETATAPNGDVWALEVCDPCEADSYRVTLRDGTTVSVSDFVTPAFFGRGSGPLDRLGLITRPFSIRPGGYAIVNNGQVFANFYPEWKKATKQFPAARTFKRLQRRTPESDLAAERAARRRER